MEFNTLTFILFFPLITILYYLLPERVRRGFLFLVSCFFYMCWNYKYIVLLLFATVSSYLAALWIERSGEKKIKKGILMSYLAVSILLLFVFKYFHMFFETVAVAAAQVGIQFQPVTLSFLLPVGISFYTFQTMGYVIDVYRGDITAERNFIDYGAFVTFFPQLVAGPIERSKNLLMQMKTGHILEPERFKKGFTQMLWGYFQKVVIADRIAVIVSKVYDNYESFSGVYIVLATILFAFQIYCDFDGYTNVAIGAARILGFDLMTNFDKPYLSTSIAQFWRRWHISLSTWLRDYLYIPLGGNRKGRLMKYRNLFITFLISGLWHGADWTYVVWGGLHGIYQIAEDIFRQLFAKKSKNNALKAMGKGILTFAAVDFAWLFFRADSVGEAFGLLGRIFTDFGLSDLLNREMAIGMGMEIADIFVLAAALMVLALHDFLKEKVSVGERIWAMPLPARWLALYVVMFVILIFGYYGPQYDAAQFIYFQF